jgi:hypothetical protein
MSKTVMLGDEQVRLGAFNADDSICEIPLYARDGSVRAYTRVDPEDWFALARYRWCMCEGYAFSRRSGLGLMHRAIMGLQPGDHRLVDHKDRDRLNNRRNNLRVTDDVGNGQNTPPRIGTSRYRGVHWNNSRRRWIACAQISGRKHHVGYFTDEDSAGAAAAAFRAAYMPFSDEASGVAR